MKKLALLILIAVLAAAWIFYNNRQQYAEPVFEQEPRELANATPGITAIVVTDVDHIEGIKNIVDQSYSEAALPDTKISFFYITAGDGVATQINDLIASQGASIIISNVAHNSIVAPFASQNNILIAETENDNDIMEAVFILTDSYNIAKSKTGAAPTVNDIKNVIASTFNSEENPNTSTPNP